jgi:hypothetical protein
MGFTFHWTSNWIPSRKTSLALVQIFQFEVPPPIDRITVKATVQVISYPKKLSSQLGFQPMTSQLEILVALPLPVS